MKGLEGFYASTLLRLIPDKNAKILICGGGVTDLKVFKETEFDNFFLSGMDLRNEVYGSNTPKFENAEALSFMDNEFDYAVMFASVHHTSLPHKVMTELYRVSRKGFLVIESRDSWLMRVAERLGLTERYEVAGNFKEHGVNGTDIPNYIFRWSEREVEKTISSYAPHVNHQYEYRYFSHYPDGIGFHFAGKVLIKLIKPLYVLFISIFEKQQNSMAIFVRKPTVPEDLKPWLFLNKETNEIEVNRDWIEKSYRKRLSR